MRRSNRSRCSVDRAHKGYAMSERIGFIGLGLMGTGFTKRLIATGHDVVGYDPDAARMDEAVQRGVRAAASAADVAGAGGIFPICAVKTPAGGGATPRPAGGAGGGSTREGAG